MSKDVEVEKPSCSAGKSLEKYSNKRSPNWSDTEIRLLCGFVKEHKEKLFGLGEEANKKGVNAAKKQHWELAAALINEQCSTSRHWSQVRKKWKDLSYLYQRNSTGKKLHNKYPCKILQEELANVEDQTIKLTDVSSSCGSDCSSSSSESGSSVISGVGAVCNESNFVDVSVKAEILDEEQLAPPKLCLLESSDIQTQNSSTFQRRENGARVENTKTNCCCVYYTENCYNSNGRLSSLIETILEKQLRSDSKKLKTSMSAYEKARLQLEKEKFALQEKTAKCLRDISKEIKQISATLCRVKRRRNFGNYVVSHKRQRWRSESDSSVN